MGKRGPKPGTGGRPPMQIDMEVAFRAASIGCTREEIAALVGMSAIGLKARMDRDEELAEKIEQARDKGRATLRRYQWQAAANGNSSMLIWLGKQMLGQSDQHQITGANGGPIQIVTGVRREVETIDGEATDLGQADTYSTGVARASEPGD